MSRPGRALPVVQPAPDPAAAAVRRFGEPAADATAGTRARRLTDPATVSLWEALRDVRDPELPISIVDLGLVYGVRRAGDAVEIDLTFTAMACPCMDFICSDVRDRLLAEPGVDSVAIRLVWDPPWNRDMVSEEGRAILRRYGVAA